LSFLSFSNPLFVLAILCLNIVVSEWLVKKTFCKHLGTALVVIIITAITANIHIIPSASEKLVLYEGIFTYVAPIALFFLLLDVNLRSILKAGLPMLLMFLIGSIGTVIGVLTSVWIFSAEENIGDLYHAISGMYTATYTGGSINLNALALHYEVNKEGNIYAGTVAIDNIISALWMVATIIIPKVLLSFFPRISSRAMSNDNQDLAMEDDRETEKMNPMDISLMLFLGIIVLWISNIFTKMLSDIGVNIPSILVLTTLALILAQIPAFNKLKGSRLLGMFSVYLFLAVIGAYCELAALSKIGSLAAVLLGFASVAVLIHGLITFGLGALLRQEWELIAIASQANIGGSTTALALSKSLKRTDLLLPAILVGSLGNGLGTYLGFLVAGML